MSEVVRTAYLLEPRPGPACDTLSAKTKESAERIKRTIIYMIYIILPEVVY